MNFNTGKKAFSLTEMLIVIVVVAVLFSAILPIMTKRHATGNSGKIIPWQFVGNDTEQDAYFDDGSAIIGRRPRHADNWVPYGKLVINANEYQDQIQFRYGENEGVVTGLLFASQTNLGLTSRLRCENWEAGTANTNNCNGNYKKPFHIEAGNTYLGSGVASNVGGSILPNPAENLDNRDFPYYSTTIGANSSKGHYRKNNELNSNTVIGAGSNPAGSAINSVIVGAQSAKGEPADDRNNIVEDTVVVGDHVLSSPKSQATRSVLLGSHVAAIGQDTMRQEDSVLVGSSYIGKVTETTPGGAPTARRNVILGYGSMADAPAGIQNTTVAGYKACDSLRTYSPTSSTFTGPSSFTCIGYESGKGYGAYDDTIANNDGGTDHSNLALSNYISWEKDGREHIFLGGSPKGGMPGRAALEVHNGPYGPKTNTSYNPKPLMDPTVVLNSHLVVRGNLYFPDKNGYVTTHILNPMLMKIGEEEEELSEDDYEAAADSCSAPHFGTPSCSIDQGNCYWWWASGSDASDLVGGSSAYYKWRSRRRSADWEEDRPGAFLATFALGVLLACLIPGVGAGISTALIATLYAVTGTAIVVGFYGSLYSIAYNLLHNATLNDKFIRPKDATSGSVMTSLPKNSEADYDSTNTCSSLSNPYLGLTGASNTASDESRETKAECPNLKLSDIRLKENLTENTDAIEKILLIQPYNYTFKKDLNKREQTGVIAQDLQTYFPQSVSEDNNGYLKIRWDEMFFATINSVKSLDKTLDDIQNNADKINADIMVIGKSQKDIKNRINKLNKEINKLEK